MRSPFPSSHGARGASLVELVLVVGVLAVLGGMGASSMLSLRSDARALGAARYLAARLGEQRINAIRRGTSGGFLVAGTGSTTLLQLVVDGNGNGLRSEDVVAGIDRLLGVALAIDHLFPGMAFGIGRPVPPIDGEGSGLAEGADPVRIGGSRFLSFSAAGTGTSGTLYLTNRDRRQLAVRVFGATGRVRVFEFLPATGQWSPR